MMSGKYSKKIVKTKKSIYFSICIVLLSLWFVIAVLRVSVDFSYLPKDIPMIFLTNQQKRNILYGEINHIFSTVNNSTPKNARILLITQESESFFLGQYLLYPKRLYWSNESRNSESLKNYTSVLVYKPNSFPKNYIQTILRGHRIKSVKIITFGKDKEDAILLAL